MEQAKINLFFTASLAGLAGFYLFDRRRENLSLTNLLTKSGAVGAGALLWATWQQKQTEKAAAERIARRDLVVSDIGEKVDDSVKHSATREETIHMQITQTLGVLHQLELQCENLTLPFSKRDAACQQIPALLAKLEELESLIQPTSVIAGAEIDDFAMASAAAAG